MLIFKWEIKPSFTINAISSVGPLFFQRYSKIISIIKIKIHIFAKYFISIISHKTFQTLTMYYYVILILHYYIFILC